ncbi:hypothetical protein V2J09_014204 [Rumex salicifolius]
MYLRGKVKEEIDFSSYNFTYPEEISLIYLPQPLESLQEADPPPFLTKTYDLVDDPCLDPIISWSRENNSFVGFRKVDPDKWEFANEYFLRGQRHLMKRIKRRKTTSNLPQTSQTTDACVELGRFGLDVEIDRLKRDKQVLMSELVKVNQQQQNTKTYLQSIEQKLKGTEKKQKQMMNFLAKAIQNPEFLHKLVQHKSNREELKEAIARKKRRPTDQGHQSVMCNNKSEADQFGGVLAMEMEGLGRGKALDEGFWEGLLEDNSLLGVEDNLVHCLNHDLGSGAAPI